MSKLTTHVLETSAGVPAAGMKIELWQLDTEDSVSTFKTNSDGRVDKPLLEDDGFKKGIYELRFFVADYFKSRGVVLPDPPFLEVVPVRFGIADVTSHYHVPLLVSPFGYSTYRGS